MKTDVPIYRLHPLYRIHLVCPACGDVSEAVAPMIPRPSFKCGDCLMERVDIVEMTIVAAEQEGAP